MPAHGGHTMHKVALEFDSRHNHNMVYNCLIRLICPKISIKYQQSALTADWPLDLPASHTQAAAVLRRAGCEA